MPKVKITKKQLIDTIAAHIQEEHGRTVSKANIKAILASQVEIGTKVLADGGVFPLGLGNLSIRTSEPRLHRNPITGGQVPTPKRNHLKFRPTTALKQAVNK